MGVSESMRTYTTPLAYRVVPISSEVRSGLGSPKTSGPYFVPRDNAIAMSCLPGYKDFHRGQHITNKVQQALHLKQLEHLCYLVLTALPS